MRCFPGATSPSFFWVGGGGGRGSDGWCVCQRSKSTLGIKRGKRTCKLHSPVNPRQLDSASLSVYINILHYNIIWRLKTGTQTTFRHVTVFFSWQPPKACVKSYKIIPKQVYSDLFLTRFLFCWLLRCWLTLLLTPVCHLNYRTIVSCTVLFKTICIFVFYMNYFIFSSSRAQSLSTSLWG